MSTFFHEFLYKSEVNQVHAAIMNSKVFSLDVGVNMTSHRVNFLQCLKHLDHHFLQPLNVPFALDLFEVLQQRELQVLCDEVAPVVFLIMHDVERAILQFALLPVDFA